MYLSSHLIVLFCFGQEIWQEWDRDPFLRFSVTFGMFEMTSENILPFESDEFLRHICQRNVCMGWDRTSRGRDGILFIIYFISSIVL